MKTHATIPGKGYTVTSGVDCTVSTPGGVIIVTHAPNSQTLFVAPTAQVVVSDDDALITEAFKGASLAVAGGGGCKVPAEDAGVFDVLEYDDLRGLSVVHADANGTVDNRLRVMVTPYAENIVGAKPLTVQAPSVTHSTAHQASSYTDTATGSSYAFWGHTTNDTEMGAYGIEEPCVWLGDPALPTLLRGSEVTVNGSATLNGYTMEAFPVGTILPSLATAMPGYLLCDGASYAVSDYPELAALLGAPEGDAAFIVPDMRGRTLWGANETYTPNTAIAAGLPNITGSIGSSGLANFAHPTSINVTTGSFYQASSGQVMQGLTSGNTSGNVAGFDASRSSWIYGNSTTVQPPARAVNFFIKY